MCGIYIFSLTLIDFIEKMSFRNSKNNIERKLKKMTLPWPNFKSVNEWNVSFDRYVEVCF